MKPKRKSPNEETAFVLEDGDRFHRIIVSEGVRYEMDDAAETVITFFVIRRAGGNFEIVNVVKTFRGGRCVSSNVQAKIGIPGDKVSDEIDAVRVNFALKIEQITGHKLKWHELDLSDIEDQAEQVASISAWGRVKDWTAAEGAAWN